MPESEVIHEEENFDDDFFREDSPEVKSLLKDIGISSDLLDRAKKALLSGDFDFLMKASIVGTKEWAALKISDALSSDLFDKEALDAWKNYFEGGHVVPAESGESDDLSEKIASIQRRAESLSRTIGRDHSMQVRVGKEGSGTHWNWKENIVTIDQKFASKTPEQALGAISHEGMHRRISRMDFVSQDVFKEKGFNALLQATEDVRVNSALEIMYPGAGDWIRETMQDIHNETDLITTISRINSEHLNEVGYVPYQFEFVEAIERKWTYGEYDLNTSTVVQEALKKAQPFLDEHRLNIPPIDAKEDNIVEYAKKGFSILRKKIWPIYKELIEMDEEEETLRQAVLAMANGEADELLDNLLGTLDESTGELEELTEMLNSHKKKTESKPSESFNMPNLREMSSGLRSKIKDIVNKQKGTDSNNEDTDSSGDSNSDSNESESGNKDKSSNKFKEAAKKALQDHADEISENLRPKLVDPEEYKSVREFMEELEKDEALAKAVLEARLKEEEEKKKKETSYKKYYDEVSAEIDSLVYELQDILYPNKATRWRRGFSSGSRATLGRVMQFEADPRKKNDLFEKKNLADKKEYKFTLLVDLSGSMNGVHSEEAIKATILFAEVLDRIGIDFEILGFNTLPTTEYEKENYVFKGFGRTYDADSKKKVERVITDVDTMAAAKNDDGPAIKWASDRMAEQNGERKFIFVISDGQPAYSRVYGDARTGDFAMDKMIRYSQDTGSHIIGLGIGPGTTAVREFYKTNRVVSNVKELSPVIGSLIADIIENPQNYM